MKHFKGILPVVTTALLVLAAFVLCITIVLTSVTLRRRVSILVKQEIPSAAPRDAELDVPQTFAAAAAASEEARRARLLREKRMRGILTPVAFGLSGLIVMFALAALFLVGDREAATACAFMAVISLGSTTTAYLSAKHARHN